MKAPLITLLAGMLIIPIYPTTAPCAEPANATAIAEKEAHAHEEDTKPLPPVTIGPWTANVSVAGTPKLRGEYNVDIKLKGPSAFPRALRAWLGNEAADQTGKTRVGASGHAHLPVPAVLTKDDRLWIEIEEKTGKTRTGIIIPGNSSEHDHQHAQGAEGDLKATVDSIGYGVYTLSLKDASGKMLGKNDFKVVHEHSVHLVAVDGSLTDFQHIHPTANDKGAWMFKFTPQKPGAYRLYAEATLNGDAEASYSLAELANAGVSGEITRTNTTTATVDGIRFDLNWMPEPSAGHAGKFKITITGADGSSPTLDPLMGALAHVVSLGEDADSFNHAHPEVAIGKTSGELTTIIGEVKLDEPGFQRLFVHLKVAGKELIVPFGYTVTDKAGDHGHSHEADAHKGHNH